MKTQTPYSLLRTCSILLLAVTMFFQSCKNEEVVIAPQVTTITASNVTFNSATMGGTVKSNGGADIKAKGICYATTAAPTVQSDTTNQGAGSQNFTSQITDLLPNTKYFARAYATNSAGTGYGEEFSFTTGAGLPTVTLAVSNISYKELTASWTVTAQGASAVSLSGWVISTANALPVTGTDMFAPFNTNATFVEKKISDLTTGTKYYVRAFATNNQGTAYSNVIEATTLALPTATDADGNVYGSVLIGTQIWMDKNLRVTKFSNGDAIPTTATASQNISGETSPLYYWAPNGNQVNVSGFGLLYTSYVAMDNRNVCPAGWHVPTSAEWVTLSTYLGEGVAGTKLKTTGVNYWNHDLGTNTTGFSGVGAGLRFSDGTYGAFKQQGEYWSTTAYDANENKQFMLYSQFAQIDNYWRPKSTGLAIRCIKN
jgi:uncharacterized protein (TIGR02145 family)